jgi:hypothetical protein
MIRRLTAAGRPAVMARLLAGGAGVGSEDRVDVLQFRQGRCQLGDRLPAVDVQRYLDQWAPRPGIRVVLAGGFRAGPEGSGGDVIDGEAAAGGLGQDIA